MAFRIIIDFPALDRFAAALERYLDGQEGVIADRVNRLADSLDKQQDRLQGSVDQNTPKSPAKP